MIHISWYLDHVYLFYSPIFNFIIFSQLLFCMCFWYGIFLISWWFNSNQHHNYIYTYIWDDLRNNINIIFICNTFNIMTIYVSTLVLYIHLFLTFFNIISTYSHIPTYIKIFTIKCSIQFIFHDIWIMCIYFYSSTLYFIIFSK